MFFIPVLLAAAKAIPTAFNADLLYAVLGSLLALGTIVTGTVKVVEKVIDRRKNRSQDEMLIKQAIIGIPPGPWGEGHPGLIQNVNELTKSVTTLIREMSNLSQEMSHLTQRFNQHLQDADKPTSS